jgi:hypothetical protein
MDPIDQLPPDQSAVLSLLLRQGRSYADIANLLGIPEATVRERAHAALDAISGGPTTAPPRARRAPARPGVEPPRPRAGEPEPPRSRATRPASTSRPASAGSRRAGALLLAAIVAVVVVAVILIANSGGGSSHGSANASSTSTSTSTGAGSSTSAGGPHVDKQLTLSAADPSSSATGLVEIVSEGSKQAFLLSAEHLPPTSGGFFYAAWLSNSSGESVALGRAPSVSSNGKLQAVGALPNNAANFHTMLLTRETSTHAKQPGPTVLSGAFSVG